MTPLKREDFDDSIRQEALKVDASIDTSVVATADSSVPSKVKDVIEMAKQRIKKKPRRRAPSEAKSKLEPI